MLLNWNVYKIKNKLLIVCFFLQETLLFQTTYIINNKSCKSQPHLPTYVLHSGAAAVPASLASDILNQCRWAKFKQQ